MHFVGFWEKGPYDMGILEQNLRNHIFLKNRSIGYIDFDY